MKNIALWSIIFLICIMVFAMTVMLTDKLATLSSEVSDMGKGVLAGVSTKLEESDFPYDVKFDGKTVTVTNSKGEEVKNFEISPVYIPEDEIAMLKKGIKLNSMSELWNLIESYTS